MREIKFRAWFKDKKEMRNVSIDNVYKGNMCYLYLSPMPGSNYELIELMQYTGIKDELGKEVFDGDIVCCVLENENFIVEWDEIGTGYLFHYVHDEKRTHGIDYYEFEDMCGSFGFEVIGNIYENPELIAEQFDKTQ